MYDEVSIKIKSNPGMPPQIKEHFASVFNKASDCAGGGKWGGLIEMRPLSWKSPTLRQLEFHCSEEGGLNDIIQDFGMKLHTKL